MSGLWERWHELSKRGGLDLAGCQMLGDWKKEADGLRRELETANQAAEKLKRGSCSRGQDGEIRPEVQWFAGEMEKKLRANNHKGGWKNCEPSYLIGRLREEYEEMLGLMLPQDAEKIIPEAADVANFAMMIADIASAALDKTRKGDADAD